jgi:hypothetical protein
VVRAIANHRRKTGTRLPHGTVTLKVANKPGDVGIELVVTADLGGEPAVVLLGDPGWYAHFGFETAAEHGIGSPGPWPDRYFQVRRLQSWRPELAGPFRYAPAFDLDIG